MLDMRRQIPKSDFHNNDFIQTMDITADTPAWSMSLEVATVDDTFDLVNMNVNILSRPKEFASCFIFRMACIPGQLS